MDLLGGTVVHTFEFLTGTDRPVDRAGGNTELFLDIIQQFKSIHGVTVHFINERKNRDMSHDTDFKQFSGLRLDTLGSVNDHDRRICSHQGTIGILREILMSRCIQNVDTVIIIIELQYGRGNRNTSLLLDLHPVGNCMSCGCFSFYGTCQIDGSSI